jgi:hypothetical protein
MMAARPALGRALTLATSVGVTPNARRALTLATRMVATPRSADARDEGSSTPDARDEGIEIERLG